MGITALTGPLVVYGAAPAPTDYNAQRGPSPFDQFVALADPRVTVGYQPGQAANAPVAGWFNGGEFTTVDAAPAALAANNIAASQSPGAGAIALVSASGAGVTVGTSVVNINTGVTVTGLLALDGAGGRISYGSDGSIQMWDPGKCLGRVLRYVSGGSDAGITFTCAGFDVYGTPMTETVTGAAVGTATGKKAFKYIQSITHTGSVAGTLTIGTTDTFGLPLRCDIWGYISVTWNNAIITANTGFTVPDATSPATATTGDVRGTYALQTTPSDGTRRLLVFQSISPANISSIAGLLGVTQF
jgi:hypothetical protein